MREHGAPRGVRGADRTFGHLLAGLLIATLGVLSTATNASAESAGSIDHVETNADELNLLYSVPGLPDGVEPDLGSLQVSINDEAVQASAALPDEAASTDTVRRTSILTIDVSNSMRGERFAEAKEAASAFLDAAPADVMVGIVAFAGDVQTIQEPTLDRGQLNDAVEGLALSQQTRLYDGVSEAIKAVGREGQRSLLVLSDGKDTSDTSIENVTNAIRNAEVKVDVVALEQSADAREPLEQMATAGGGALLTADDPTALVKVFSDEAADLAKQVLVTVRVPQDLSGIEGSVAVSIEAADEAYTDTAFVTLKKGNAAPVGQQADTVPKEITPPRFQVSTDMMWLGLGATGVGVLLIASIALGVFTRAKKETLADRIGAYSRTGDRRRAPEGVGQRPKQTGSPRSVTDSAVGMAEKALSGSKGLEVALASRLDAAGMTLRPAEWLLLHAGLATGAAVLAFMVSSGNPLMTVVLLAVGAFVPWVYLGMKRGRRLKAFNSHLPETLQLMSGSLSAGLSLAQSIDTVVREGTQPIAGEFRRALIEARLGVAMEDALESVGSRMESEDFDWVVMSIRIQREVGGNLAELLLKVAATMREREYLRRQVKSLSAEGRLSAWIIGGLPPAFVVYLSLVNPGYLEPLFETSMGWIMIGVMCVLMAVGSFWMSRVVKVEV